MVLAKDKIGGLKLWNVDSADELERDEFNERWIKKNGYRSMDSFYYMNVDDNFWNLKWEDEPYEVTLVHMIGKAESVSDILECIPPVCRVCSHAACMQPMGKLACEFYEERENYKKE